MLQYKKHKEKSVAETYKTLSDMFVLEINVNTSNVDYWQLTATANLI